MASTSKGKGTKGLKGMWKKQNKNVSVTALTRNHRAFIKSLRVAVQVDQKSKHGNSKSVCWSYFGNLCYLRDSDEKEIILNDRLYCSLCLQDIQSKAHSESSMCHISNISNFSLQTSTGNLNLHLNSKHGIQVMSDSKLQQIVSYFRSYSGSQSDSKMKSKPPTEHEFNRDLAILFCRSLLPFSTVTNEAFHDFLGKYLSDLTVPCASTVSGTALNDIYTASVAEIRKLLDGVRSICVMTDSWTDRYKAKPYMAIRISFVKQIIHMNCSNLFNRLIVLAERQLDVSSFFSYELTPVSCSLFKDGMMRFSYELTPVSCSLFKDGMMRKPDKAALGRALSNDAFSNVHLPSECIVIDGGALLHRIRWQRMSTYHQTADQYATYVTSKNGRNVTVIFDGYCSGLSTKDHEHIRRTSKVAASVMISADTTVHANHACPKKPKRTLIYVGLLLIKILHTCNKLIDSERNQKPAKYKASFSKTRCQCLECHHVSCCPTFSCMSL